MGPLACCLSGIALLCCTLACIIMDGIWHVQCKRKRFMFDAADDVQQAARDGRLADFREALDAEENLREVRD